MNGVGGNVLIAIISVVLGAPFLNFILNLTRAKVDRNNVIVTGAGSTVTAMNEAVNGLRKELNAVREDLTDAQNQLDQQAEKHVAEIRRIRAEHRVEMVELRAQRDDLARLVKRLEKELIVGPEEQRLNEEKDKP